MARRTVRAGDLDPDTPITEGAPEPDEPEPPAGSVFFEVWEGYVRDNGTRSWPPRLRVKAWVGLERTALAFVQAFEEINAQAVLTEDASPKYYVAVRVEMIRTLS